MFGNSQVLRTKVLLFKNLFFSHKFEEADNPTLIISFTSVRSFVHLFIRPHFLHASHIHASWIISTCIMRTCILDTCIIDTCIMDTGIMDHA